MRIYIILIACVYIQQFNFIQKRPYGTVVNTYAAQSGGCRFESLWGFGFSLKGAYYEVGYCGKKNFLSWTAMHIDFVMCKNNKNRPFLVFHANKSLLIFLLSSNPRIEFSYYSVVVKTNII